MPGAQRLCGLQGVTPLHIAATMGHEKIASLLISFRALVSFPITSACKVSAVCSAVCLDVCLSVHTGLSVCLCTLVLRLPACLPFTLPAMFSLAPCW